MNAIFENILRRLEGGQLTRILAFGSSNTERRLPGMHWFDCLDLALKQKFGRSHRCLNAGIGGDTSDDLLARFEQDAAFYQPHAVIITIGGNDCVPEKNLNAERFEQNLRELKERFDRMNSLVIFQTYYAVIPDDGPRYRTFLQYTDLVRKVAGDTGAALIDNMVRWERLRIHCPQLYLPLMEDPYHLVERGNKVMGMDIVRHFGLGFLPDMAVWSEALQLQRIMDDLEREEQNGRS